MTKQQLFDRVAAHLIRQQEQSRHSGGCLYRGPNGLRCAVGVLIPDGLYHESFEQSFVPALPAAVLAEIGLVGEALETARALQAIHDNEHPQDWPATLIAFAEEWRLDPGIVEDTLAEVCEPLVPVEAAS